MDRKKIELVEKNTAEVITHGELVQILDVKKHPKAYCGFEPSG